MTQEALGEPRVVNHAYIDVCPELLVDLLRVPEDGVRIGDRIVRFYGDAIPEGAKAVRCGITDFGNVRVVLESDTFPDTFSGNPIKMLSPKYTTELCDDSNS